MKQLSFLEEHPSSNFPRTKHHGGTEMGKRKQGKKNAAALSQEEIWDDSALIQSWEDAVEEYKVSICPHPHGICRPQALTQGVSTALP